MDNKIVYVVSDSVGETADLVVRAAMGAIPHLLLILDVCRM